MTVDSTKSSRHKSALSSVFDLSRFYCSPHASSDNLNVQFESKETQDSEPPKDLSSIPFDLLCLLFPTYAVKDGDDWVIRVKGRAFSKARPSRVNKLALGLARRAIGLEKGTESYEDFEQRFGLLLDDNSAELDLKVEVLGLSTTGSMVIEGTNRSVEAVKPLLSDEQCNKSTLKNGLLTNDSSKSYVIETPESIEYPIDAKTPEKIIQERIPFSKHFTSTHPNINPLESFFLAETLNDKDRSSIFSMELNTSQSTRHLSDSPLLDNFDDLFISKVEQPCKKNVNETLIKVKNGHFNSDMTLPGSVVNNWSPRPGKKTLIIKGCDIPYSTSIYGLVQLIEPKGVSVISDIDDTIKDTGINKGKKHVLSSTFAQETKDVSGMADVYKYWALKGANFHYVSNSPWQLFPMLERFFQKYSFPLGSAHLKFFEPKSHKALFYDPQAAKKESIIKIINDFPKRKFILVGDSGEMDLELYTSIARDYPQQIIKIFIRDVFSGLTAEAERSLSKASGSNSFHPKSLFLNSRNYFSFSHEVSTDDEPLMEQEKEVITDSRNPLNKDRESAALNKVHAQTLDYHSGSINSESCFSASSLTTSAVQLLRDSFMQRFSAATLDLPPELVVLFNSPHTLLECPVLKLYFDLYPNHHLV